MEGFTQIRLKPWLRRLVTRGIALVPALLAVAVMGDDGVNRLLVLSQVVLGLQLPFAIWPLIRFTADRSKMGDLVNPRWITGLAGAIMAVIVILNGRMLIYLFP